MALAELAVEQGADDGVELELAMVQLGDTFDELYWPQTVEYTSGVIGATTEILKQNHGSQAAVMRQRAHSALMPASLMTRAHFAVSCSM